MENILFYTQPTIIGLNSTRPYVTFKHVISKKRYRVFSGVNFGMGTTRGLDERELSLYFRTLLNKVITELGNGWNPEESSPKAKAKKIEKANKPLRFYNDVLCDYIDKADYGKKHRYTLKWYWVELIKQFAVVGIDDIADSDILTHLMNRYASSNTSYNTAKRYYRCLFNLLVQLGHTENNPVSGLKNKKAEASINQAFSKVELKLLMEYLKIHDRILYRVALLMYTTFLRPHQEIRGLKAKYFDFSSSLLILPPRFTKNGKQVTIPLQTLVTVEFDFIKQLSSDDLIFGEVNPDYFKTKWGKIKKKYL